MLFSRSSILHLTKISREKNSNTPRTINSTIPATRRHFRFLIFFSIFLGKHITVKILEVYKSKSMNLA